MCLPGRPRVISQRSERLCRDLLLTVYRWVQTDLGQAGADAFGYEKAAITVEESVSGLIKVIDASSRETHGGKLWVYDGQQVPW